MIEQLLLLAGHHLFHHLCEGGESKGRKLVYKYSTNPNISDSMSLTEARVNVQGVRQELSNMGKWLDNPVAGTSVGEFIKKVDAKL